eukprot:1633324-Rhodomonas_salina.1
MPCSVPTRGICCTAARCLVLKHSTVHSTFSYYLPLLQSPAAISAPGTKVRYSGVPGAAGTCAAGVLGAAARGVPHVDGCAGAAAGGRELQGHTEAHDGAPVRGAQLMKGG